MDGDSHAFEGLGNFVASAHDVAHLETRSQLDVDADQFVGAGLVVVVRTQAGIADGLISLRVLMALVLSDGSDGIAGGERGSGA